MKIVVENISKILRDGTKLLDNLSFEVAKGEFVGILGPSGAGKTLTIRCINGLLTPSEGEVRLEYGTTSPLIISHSKGKQLKQARQQIGVIFQGFNLVKRLTALENVLIGRLGSISPMRSMVRGFTDREAEEALALLRKVGIEDLALRRVASLSGGEAQRVAIARALFQRPTVMLADEPIANLDPSNALGVMQLLAPLKAEMPVLGVFHQPEMTARFCSRVIGLKGGKIVYDGPPQLTQEQLHTIYGEKIHEIADLQTRIP